VQEPPEHTSPTVQALPSSQSALFGEVVQPLAGLQESSVQALPSLQASGAPEAQLPAEHVSPLVQASPSLQGAVLGAATQPLAGLQESSVQALPSLQASGAPVVQAPA
jgi:hypothetical protein